MKKYISIVFTLLFSVFVLSACQKSVKDSSSGLKKIDFILDWTPTIQGFMLQKKKVTLKKRAWMLT